MNCAFFSIFYHTWKIMTKKFISDFRWRRLQVRKKNEKLFSLFFETGPVSWNYFTFFSQFHFFSCFFLPKKTSFWPVFVKKWGFSWSADRQAATASWIPPKPSRFQLFFYRVSWIPTPKPSRFKLFFSEFHEYHKWFSTFMAKISVNNTKNFKKNHEIQVTK